MDLPRDNRTGIYHETTVPGPTTRPPYLDLPRDHRRGPTTRPPYLDLPRDHRTWTYHETTVPGPAHDTVDDHKATAAHGLLDKVGRPVEEPTTKEETFSFDNFLIAFSQERVFRSHFIFDSTRIYDL
jgi:hypothetical protein